MQKYKDSTLSPKERAKDLVSLMTLDEKLQQINYPGSLYPIDYHYQNAKKGINSVKCGIYSFKYFDLEKLDYLQHFAVEKTRLGIPLLIACEGTHGLSDARATVYPTAAAVAATFDPAIAYEMTKATAEEATALGFRQVYGPNLDMVRDARFGRSEESLGEDPYLISRMGEQIVKAYKENGMAVTMKHFIGFGNGESGLQCAAVKLGERELREYMLPPFEACIKAGADGVMGSYADIDGIPAHICKRWMVEILREELGFDGLAMTDYGAAGMMLTMQGVIADDQDLAEKMMGATIDLEACAGAAYEEGLRKALRSGKVSQEQLDKAVERVLTVKFALGLFENPYFDVKAAEGKVFTKEHRQLCRTIAEKGTVLLKNDGVLPLKKDAKVALIGPNADIVQMGSYCFYPCLVEKCEVPCAYDQAITLQTALEDLLGKEQVQTEKGCGFGLFMEDRKARAVEICKQADVIIFAGGNNSIAVFGGDEGSEEQRKTLPGKDAVTSGGGGYDNHDVGLTLPQKDLLTAVQDLGKPVVFIVYGGKPLSLLDELPKLNGALYAFGVGTDGNLAIADILFGNVNPSGKLPYSIPQTAGHIPCHYNHNVGSRGHLFKTPGDYTRFGKDYVFSSTQPLFAFGYGLSYTKFAYSKLLCEKDEKGWKCSVDVQNVGDRDGEEVVLVYTRNMVQNYVSPLVKKLRKFQRISLKKGEKKTVEFHLTEEDFSYIGVDMKKTVAKGACKIMCADLECQIEV